MVQLSLLLVSVSSAQVFNDNFDRPNAADLGNGWIEKNPPAFSINGNRVAKGATAEAFADNLTYRQTSESILDGEASVELRFDSMPPGYPQLFVRGQASTIGQPGNFDGYLLFVDNNPELALLDRIENGAFIQLAQIPIYPPLNVTDNYRLRLRATGTDPVGLEANVERLVGSAWEVVGQAAIADNADTRIRESGTVGFTGFVEGDTYTFDNFQRIDLDVATSLVDFDSPTPPGTSGDLLLGEFDGLDFGVGEWRWESAFGPNSTNHIFFGSDSGTSRSIGLVGNPRVLESVRVFSSTAGVLTISDDTGQSASQTITTGGMQTVLTGWAQASAVIDLDFPGGWEMGFDDISTRNTGGSNPLPVLSGVSPTSVTVGSPGITLSVSGSGFMPESVLRWDGADRATTVISGSQLEAAIGANDLDSVGTAVVTVSNPSPGGGISAPRSVQIVAPGGETFFDDFQRPDNADIGNGWTEKYPPAFALQGGEVTSINTSPIDYHDAIVYRPVTEDRLNAEVGLEFRVLPGQSFPQVHARIQRDTITGNDQLHDYLFFVDGFEPDPGRAMIAIQPPTTGPQNYECYMLAVPFPTRLVVQDRYRLRFQVQGTDPVVLTGTVDRFDGNTWQVFATATALHDDNTVRDPNLFCATATMPPPIRTAGAVGFAKWEISNEVLDNFFWNTIDGGNPVPTLASVSPDQVAAGGPGLTLMLTGSQFFPGSTVLWNGANRPTTYQSATLLEADIAANDIASPGSVAVTVRNPAPGGGVSNAQTLTIVGSGGGANLVDFDNPTPSGGPFALLEGEFEGLDFGVGQWRWEGAFGPDPTNHVFFASEVGTSRTLAFVGGPAVLRRLSVFAGEAGTLTLTDDAGQQRSQIVSPGALTSVETGWMQPASVVTVNFTGGWALGVDDIEWE
jgi:hypothetical protein